MTESPSSQLDCYHCSGQQNLSIRCRCPIQKGVHCASRCPPIDLVLPLIFHHQIRLQCHSDHHFRCYSDLHHFPIQMHLLYELHPLHNHSAFFLFSKTTQCQPQKLPMTASHSVCVLFCNDIKNIFHNILQVIMNLH